LVVLVIIYLYAKLVTAYYAVTNFANILSKNFCCEFAKTNSLQL